MKNIIKTFIAIFFVACLWSCKKEDNRVIFKGGTAPVLASSVSGNIPLSIGNKNSKAVTFQWTNPNYEFSTGVNSLDVTYTLQIDTSGANFSSRGRQEKSVARDLSTILTVGELNSYLAKMGLLENISHNIEVRLKASLTNESVPLYSNVIKFAVTPYLDVVVPLPLSGDLFLIGGVTDPDWKNPVAVPEQKFTKTSSTTYEITLPLIGGQEFLVIPQNGSWDHKYAITRGNNDISGLRSGGDFGYDWGDNFYGPTASGTYKIELNFKTGKYTVTKQ